MLEILEQQVDDRQDDEPPQYELATFLHGIAMMGPSKRKADILEQQPERLMQWLCTHIHTFVLSDFILVNRHLVALGVCEKEYLQMLANDFYCAPDEGQPDKFIYNRLRKSDIMELTQTYNMAG